MLKEQVVLNTKNSKVFVTALWHESLLQILRWYKIKMIMRKPTDTTGYSIQVNKDWKFRGSAPLIIEAEEFIKYVFWNHRISADLFIQSKSELKVTYYKVIYKIIKDSNA